MLAFADPRSADPGRERHADPIEPGTTPEVTGESTRACSGWRGSRYRNLVGEQDIDLTGKFAAHGSTRSRPAALAAEVIGVRARVHHDHAVGPAEHNTRLPP
jgi:hypothetical protein